MTYTCMSFTYMEYDESLTFLCSVTYGIFDPCNIQAAIVNVFAEVQPVNKTPAVALLLT